MAAAGVLSLAVHGAVLLGRAPTGSGTSPATLQVPVLLTRSVEAPTGNVAPVPTEPEPALALPVPVEPTSAPEAPVLATPAPSPFEREPIAVAPPAEPSRETVPPAPQPPPLPAPAPPPQLAAAPLSAPAASAPAYLGSAGLDPPPRPLGDIDPLVPEAAGRRGGLVVLRLYINERGDVDRAEVLSSTPPGLFDASALEAFVAAKFSPGYFAGVAVKSQVTYEVKYRGLGSGADAAGRTY